MFAVQKLVVDIFCYISGNSLSNCIRLCSIILYVQVEYNKQEVRNLLTMIQSGNLTPESKKLDSALMKTVSAFGIAGL